MSEKVLQTTTDLIDCDGDKMMQRLADNYDVLARSLVVTQRLRFKLKTIEFICDNTGDVERQNTTLEMTEELLDVLQRVPDKHQETVFNKFLTALRQDDQGHVANVFRSESDARPMSDEHYQLLLSRQKKLCKCLDPLNGLVDRLVRGGVFNDRDRCRISNQTEPEEISRVLVQVLLYKPDSAFQKFVDALCASKQEHVASLLGGRSETGNITMTKHHRRLLIGKRSQLGEFMDPDGGLIDELVSSGVLSFQDMKRMKDTSGCDARSLDIVDMLLRKPDSAFQKFIDALQKTGQDHVVCILTGEGEAPLSRLRRATLKKARKDLISTVDTIHSSLLAELISFDVLSDADTQRIEVCYTNEDRTAVLLDAISRKSQLAYDRFISALRNSGRCQVAEALLGLELRGHVKTLFHDDTQADVRTKVVRIVRSNMRALVSGNEPDISRITSLMEQNGFAVSVVACGSILIGFRCFDAKSLANLRRLYMDKTLDRIITQQFCSCRLVEAGLESLSLDISDAEFDKCADTFRSIALMMALEQFPDSALQTWTRLPLELLELVCMRTFVKMFVDNYKSRDAIRLAYSTLSAVCYGTWQTINGWPQSPTKHWFKRKLRRVVKGICHPYAVSPRVQSTLSLSNGVVGVAYCDDKLYVLCSESDTISVFGADNEPLASIVVKGLSSPRDLVACPTARQLYVADWSSFCVWRLSLDGRQVVKWLPKDSKAASPFIPWTMSVTSGRLLVTSSAPFSDGELLLYAEDGVELRRISLPDAKELRHAVETARQTFIVSHEKPQSRVFEIDSAGCPIHIFADPRQHGLLYHVALDSAGRVFVTDNSKHRVLLLDGGRLELERVLLDVDLHQLARSPVRLCYVEQTGQLIVASWSGCVQVFNITSSIDRNKH